MVLGCGDCLSSVKWNIEFSNSNCVPGLAAAASELSAHRVRPIIPNVNRKFRERCMPMCWWKFKYMIDCQLGSVLLKYCCKVFPFLHSTPAVHCVSGGKIYLSNFKVVFSGTNGNLLCAKYEKNQASHF